RGARAAAPAIRPPGRRRVPRLRARPLLTLRVRRRCRRDGRLQHGVRAAVMRAPGGPRAAQRAGVRAAPPRPPSRGARTVRPGRAAVAAPGRPDRGRPAGPHARAGRTADRSRRAAAHPKPGRATARGRRMTVTPRLAIVLSGFPRRSETFALAEVSALVDRGMVAAVFATKPGDDGATQPAAARLLPRVRYLSPGTAAAQASEAATAVTGSTVDGVHAYFAHTPAAVGGEPARLLGVPFGFSAHARDARKLPRLELHARARSAACVVACNADVASEFDGSGVLLRVVPHGVDLDRFAYGWRSRSPGGSC